jgi:sortase B
MKPKFRKALAALLAVICALCLGRTALQLVQYRQGDETYAQAEELAGLPDLSDLPVVDFTGGSGSVSSSASADGAGEAPEEVPVWQDPYAQALKDMDFSALRQQNPDVLGWILIPGTRVSYPVVQGTDNSYYLDHTWRGGKNSVGAIFMDYRNNGDLSDFNTIIYGHRMNNRSMFGTLSQYKSRSYWQAHPYVYLTDDSGTHRYEIFAAGEVSVDSDVYRLGLRSDSSRQSFLDSCLALSALNTGVTPHTYDKVLTLSTCTGNGHATRWVVQAVCPGQAPETPEIPQEEPTPQPDASQPEESVQTPDVSQESPAEPEQPQEPEPAPSQDIRPEETA